MKPKSSSLKALRRWLLIVTLSLMATGLLASGGLTAPIRAQQGWVSDLVVDFESLRLNREFRVGDTFTDGSIAIQVEAFYWWNGKLSDGGYAKIQDYQYAGGSGKEVFTNNVNLRFGIPGNANVVVLNFSELGGNLNIEINGDFRNLKSFDEIAGVILGGTEVLVTSNPAAKEERHRQMIVRGDITSFAIGGQELALDDINMQGSFMVDPLLEAAVRILLVTQGDRAAEYHVSIMPDVARGHPNEFNQWIVTVLNNKRDPLDVYGVWDPRLILVHEVEGDHSQLVRDSDMAYLFDIVLPFTDSYNGGLPAEVLLHDQELTLLADIDLSAAINEYCADPGKEDPSCALLSLPTSIDPISTLPGAPFDLHPPATTNEAILADSEAVAACLPSELLASPELQALLQACGLLR